MHTIAKVVIFSEISKHFSLVFTLNSEIRGKLYKEFAKYQGKIGRNSYSAKYQKMSGVSFTPPTEGSEWRKYHNI